MFKKGQKIHLIGIKGVGMTALAQILKSRGCRVTGSDGPAKFFTDAVLRRFKIPVAKEFAAKNIPADTDVAVSSVAYFFSGKVLGNNPEVAETLRRIAQGKNLLIFTYPQALGMLAKEYQVIAVAGSHGKSTTTALLGWVLEKAGVDPTVIVGTKVNKWEANARVSHSAKRIARSGKKQKPLLILEADEYREAFLNFEPAGAIITSIDWDHPDYYPTKTAYATAFKKLTDKIKPKGFLIGCGDDPLVRKLLVAGKKRGLKTMSYGFKPANDLRLTDFGVVKQKQMFYTKFAGKQHKVEIQFPGKQYILNSGAALTVSQLLHVPMKKSISAISSFPGTARRLEILKKPSVKHPAIIIDDYAHHPTAIRVTLEGIHAMYPGHRLIAVFQPHMFSRTAALLDDFSRAFPQAHAVGIMEIYPSARELSGPVSGKDLFHATRRNHPCVEYLPDAESAKQFVKQFLGGENVIVLMGAGDVNNLFTK